jgi:hypothetical protein
MRAVAGVVFDPGPDRRAKPIDLGSRTTPATPRIGWTTTGRFIVVYSVLSMDP